ncbi:MAG: LCP family protein [Candidatus Saccharimonadales bacterium]
MASIDDNKNRYQAQPRRLLPRQSIDGFISHQPARQIPQFISSKQSGVDGRQPGASDAGLIDEFRRPSGYYARRVGMQNLAAKPAHPANHNKLSAKSRAVAAQSDNAPKGQGALLDDGTADGGRGGKKSRRSKMGKTWHWSLRGGLALAAVVLIIGGFLALKGFFKLHGVFQGHGTAAALQNNVNPDQLKGIGSGRVNILLMGIGGPGHDGPDLTDTMMVASIDPVNNKVALISVPRDLWVKEPNNYVSNYGKINAAYESGKYQYLGHNDSSNANQKAVTAGFSAVDKTVSNVLGIPIQYDVLFNFQAFSKAINTVGGITVNAPTQLYDPTIAWQNNNNPVIAKQGLQTMDGAKALLYSRSRETTTDFARSKRQRAVLVALKNKVLSAGTISNPWKINQLLGAFGNNVRTNLSLSDMEALQGIIRQAGNNSIRSIGLDDASNNFITTGMLYGQSIDEPKAGLFDYAQIHNFIRNTAKDGYLVKENPSLSVLNGTTINGAASRMATKLKSYGFNVVKVADAASSNHQTTSLMDDSGGQAKFSAHYLGQLLHVSSKTAAKKAISGSKGADFVIIVGSNEATSKS